MLVNDILTVGDGANDPVLVEAYGSHQLETYQWLVNKGVLFHAVQAVSGHSVPRGHTITPKQAITTLFENANSHENVTVKLKADVLRLRKNNEGRVDEVSYEKDGEIHK